MKKNYELPCYDNRKSFYGKAHVIEEKGKFKLQSYGTIVGYVKNRKFHKTWDGYSDTTMRHVNSMLRHFDLEGGGKSWWDNLKTEKE